MIITSAMFDSSNFRNQSTSINHIARQGKGSLLDGAGVSLIDPLTNTVTSTYGITGNQSAKVSAGLKYEALSYPNPDIPNRGEITPFKGFIGVTTRGKIEYCQPINDRRVEFLESIKKGSVSATRFAQSLSSIPRDCNSFLITRFIQAETDASPSCSKAVLIPCSNDGSTRKAICLFPLPDILMVDTWFTPNYIKNEHQVYDRCIPKTTPPKGITSTSRGLTTNDIISIEVAMNKHITPVTGRNSLTPSQSFRWLFLALERDNPAAKPHRIEATAPNEHSARLLLVRDYILAFAGRVPVREVTA